MEGKGEIIIYQTEDQKSQLEVRLEDETVWLSQKELSELFGKGVPTINEHIKNIYKEKELGKKSTIRKFRIVRTESKGQVTREIEFYNLDVIISVGYRVNSKRGTQFRIWATQTLKDHLVKGYTINEKRLKEQQEKFKELNQIVDFLKTTIGQKQLLSNQ
jgi:hypothetical protein